MKKNERILLSHGSGGSMMQSLIKNIFIKNFRSKKLEKMEDSAVLDNLPDKNNLCFTTDSYTVDPLFFPGGDIGKLAVCGTVNDISVMGAAPLFLSCGIIVEEGLETETLERITRSMADTAKKAGVEIVTGDFKVVEKGKADKIFINTSGLGIRKKTAATGRNLIKTGDRIIINGCIGEHELAVLSARNNFGISSGIKSDCAPLNGIISKILEVSNTVRFMRDPTRGGIAAVLNEAAGGTDKGILIYENEIPVAEKTVSLCEMLGFDPLYLANEGKVIVICGEKDSGRILSAMKKHPLGRKSAVIGEVVKEPAGRVIMKTSANSHRIVNNLSGSQLPRIC